MKSTEKGAATSVFLATSPQVESIGGRYFEDCQEAEVVDQLVGGIRGVLPHDVDPERRPSPLGDLRRPFAEARGNGTTPD